MTLARLLDLSRLASRAALPLTGVDRVERAYLSALIVDPAPVFGLIRMPLGFILLDKTGLAAFDAAITSGNFGRARVIDRLLRRGNPVRATVDGFLRRHAFAHAPRGRLAAMLGRFRPVTYVNVGQTSLRQDVLDALPDGSRVAVMIHDTIPLDHPQWQRPQAADKLRRIMALAAKRADLVIANSAVTAADLARHFAAMGPVPAILTAHLGVTLSPPDTAALPADIDLTQPYFVSLNTLEPRKNHAFLLDMWEGLGPAAPPLYLIGGKGWMVEDLMTRLATTTAPVRHLSGLSDGAVAALVANARAMVNPSLAEGFGLPALEAMGRGVPVLCGPLPVWHELLGDWPVYLAFGDVYPWQRAVMELSHQPPRAYRQNAPLPTWEAHFTKVFSAI